MSEIAATEPVAEQVFGEEALEPTHTEHWATPRSLSEEIRETLAARRHPEQVKRMPDAIPTRCVSRRTPRSRGTACVAPSDCRCGVQSADPPARVAWPGPPR